VQTLANEEGKNIFKPRIPGVGAEYQALAEGMDWMG